MNVLTIYYKECIILPLTIRSEFTYLEGGSMRQTDWKVVADRNPQGYMEVLGMQHVTRALIKSLVINADGYVLITAEPVEQALIKDNVPQEWVSSPSTSFLSHFLNGSDIFSFEIEEESDRGPRVRFAGGVLIYFNKPATL